MISLALLIALAAPKPATNTCETVWPKAEQASMRRTLDCAKQLLGYGYNGKVDAEAMSLDPVYGHPIELKFSELDLHQMQFLLGQACKKAPADKQTLCERAEEYFGGMLNRKLSTSEGVNLGSFEPALAKVLSGKPLTDKDLFGGEPDRPSWSALTLWKLRNAAYARHGYPFKSPELNAFFYRERPGKLGLLPLPQLNHAAVKLTAVDGANVRLVKKYEAALKRRRR